MNEATTAQGVVESDGMDMIDELAAFLGGADEGQPPKDEQATAAEDEELSTADGDDTLQETEAEATDEAERDEEDAGEGDEPAADERWMPGSLDELAEALETDLDTLTGGIKVQTKMDGEEGEATLAELLKTHQLDGTLTKRSQALAGERKEFEANRAEQLQALQQKAQEADDLVSAMEQEVLADYQSVDWQELQQNDPTEFLMTREQLQQRFARIESFKTKIREQRAAVAEKQQSEMQEYLKGVAKSQHEMLVDAVPEWSDDTKREKGIADVKSYMKTLGATDEEVNSVVDHRVYVIARKAMMFDQMQGKANPKAKKLKTKPKFVPPGVRKSKQDASVSKQKKTFAKAKQLQTDDAWAEALQAKLSL